MKLRLDISDIYLLLRIDDHLTGNSSRARIISESCRPIQKKGRQVWIPADHHLILLALILDRSGVYHFFRIGAYTDPDLLSTTLTLDQFHFQFGNGLCRVEILGTGLYTIEDRVTAPETMLVVDRLQMLARAFIT
jgi:hypothetical protein